MRWMWVLTTNFPMSILHSLDIVCGFDSIERTSNVKCEFVVSNPIRDRFDWFEGSVLIQRTWAGYRTNTGLSLLDVS